MLTWLFPTLSSIIEQTDTSYSSFLKTHCLLGRVKSLRSLGSLWVPGCAWTGLNGIAHGVQSVHCPPLPTVPPSVRDGRPRKECVPCSGLRPLFDLWLGVISNWYLFTVKSLIRYNKRTGEMRSTSTDVERQYIQVACDTQFLWASVICEHGNERREMTSGAPLVSL